MGLLWLKSQDDQLTVAEDVPLKPECFSVLVCDWFSIYDWVFHHITVLAPVFLWWYRIKSWIFCELPSEHWQINKAIRYIDMQQNTAAKPANYCTITGLKWSELNLRIVFDYFSIDQLILNPLITSAPLPHKIPPQSPSPATINCKVYITGSTSFFSSADFSLRSQAVESKNNEPASHAEWPLLTPLAVYYLQLTL